MNLSGQHESQLHSEYEDSSMGLQNNTTFNKIGTKQSGEKVAQLLCPFRCHANTFTYKVENEHYLPKPNKKNTRKMGRSHSTLALPANTCHGCIRTASPVCTRDTRRRGNNSCPHRNMNYTPPSSTVNTNTTTRYKPGEQEKGTTIEQKPMEA